MTDAPDRMRTGIAGLDHLLEGGLVRGNSLLLEGPPGSGKTTIAIRMLYEGIVRYGEPGLIITFEEFPKQIYREARAYGIDLEALEDEGKLRIVWTPPDRILEGFRGKSDLVDTIIRDLGVKRLVIDSITHFKRVAHDESALRETLADILNRIKLRGINALLVKELERIDGSTIAFEEYLVDASLRIHNTGSETGGANLRALEIRKTRGQGHVSGRHPFRLGAEGVRVFPALRPSDVRVAQAGSGDDPAKKVPLGVPSLDAMVGGGLEHGALHLVRGGAGTGKSVLATHFVATGLHAGERALLVQLRGIEGEPVRALRGIVPEDVVAERFDVLRVPMADASLEEVMDDLWGRVRKATPGRLVLDAVDDLRRLTPIDNRIRDAVAVLVEMSHSFGMTTLLLEDGHDDHLDTSEQVRSVLQLTLTETDGELRRFLGIRKGSAGAQSNHLREFVIDDSGLHVRQKPTGLGGILSGDARGSLTDVAATVMPCLEEVEKELAALEGKSVRGRVARVRELRKRITTIDVLLREHFGLTDFASVVEEMAPREGDA